MALTMDAPSIQAVTTSDGLSIAYAVVGEGIPIILLPFHHNHVLLRWEGPPMFRGLAEHFRILHYDSRGQGLSTRGRSVHPTAADYRRDLEAVIKASGFERFALVAYGGFGHVGMRYAVDNPERVIGLTLICTCESFVSWPRAAFHDLAAENWDLFLELQTRGLPRDFARRAIADANQTDYLRMIRCFMDSDVSDVMGKVVVPTLFVHSLDQHWLAPSEGAKLAAKIENARIVFIDGDVEPDENKAVPEIVRFLKGVHSPEVIGPMPSGQVTSTSDLSARQLEVLKLISEGKRTREIAEALVLSERTVERHIADVYTKIGARNRAEATAYLLSRPELVPS